MMKRQGSVRIWLIVALQLIVLFSIVGKYHYIEATGTTVMLKTAPIDPTDLFYGDYVILGYEIEQIEKSKVEHGELAALLSETNYVSKPHNVYVVLEQKGNPWHEAVGIYLNQPKLAPNQAVLKGRIEYFDKMDDKFFVDYGVDRYYVPENTGKEIEDNREMYDRVELRTSGSGDAVIIRLHQQTK